MINSLQQDYDDAVARGDTQTIKYLSVIMGGVRNDPVASASVGLGTNTPPNATQTPMAGDFLGSSIPFAGIFDKALDSITGANVAASDPAAQPGTLGGFLSFIGDIPRIATTLVGGLMIAAGLFALAGGSHTQIIQLVKKP